MPPLREHALDLVVAAVLRDKVLPGGRAEAGQVAIEIGVVEVSRDSVGGKAEDAQRVAAQLEVAEVPGDDDHRPLADQQPHQRGHVAERDVFPPVRLVDLPRHVGHFQHQQEQVFPHPPGERRRARSVPSSGKAWARFSSTTLARMRSTSCISHAQAVASWRPVSSGRACTMQINIRTAT